MKTKFIKLIIFISLSSIVQASNIQLKNNSFIIKPHCKYQDPEYKYLSGRADKEYEFIFESKNNVFQNYNLVDKDTITFITDLYTVKPTKAYASNKSVIHAFISEKDFLNIYRDILFKVNFKSDIFISNMNDEVHFMTNPEDIPYISLFFDPKLRNNYLEECSQSYDASYQQFIEQKKEKENKKIQSILLLSLIGIAILIIVAKIIISYLKKAKNKVVKTVDKVKEDKRKEEIKTLIEDETIKETIKNTFNFSDKNNINELQEAISDALKKNDIIEAQKLMDILKKITEK